MCAITCPQPAEADAVSTAYPLVNPSKLAQRSHDMRKAIGMMQRVLRLAEILAISLSPGPSVTTFVKRPTSEMELAVRTAHQRSQKIKSSGDMRQHSLNPIASGSMS